MHALWLELLETMNESHVNHFERAGVLPIAFSVNHMVRLEDHSCTVLMAGATEPRPLGRGSLWETDGWAARTQIAIDDVGKETTVEVMEGQRIGDYPAFVDYAHQIFDRTERWLDGLPSASMTDALYGGTYPDFVKNSFINRVVRDETILMVDALECWVYQHGIRHLGEVEHARALVGLGGLTS